MQVNKKNGIKKEIIYIRWKHATIILIFVISLSFLFSVCSPSKSNRIKKTTKISKKPTIEWILEEKQQTFYKNIENISNFAYYYDNTFNQEYLVNYNENSQTFFIFDYNSAELITQFKIEHQINSMYVHSVDSIFVCYNSVFGGKGNVFGLINRNGKVVEIYNMTQNMVIPAIRDSNKQDDKLKLKVTLADNPYSFTNFCFFENSFYLNISPQTTFIHKFLYPIMALAPLENKNGQVYSYMFHYPKTYKQNKYFKADYMDFVVKKEAKGITNIIISHILTDSVEIHRMIPKFIANEKLIFDTPEYDTLIYKNIKSKFKGKMYPINGNINAESAFMGFKYPYFKYDKFRNIYYRIAVHPVDTDTVPNEHIYMKANTGAQKTIAKYQNWSVIVADSLLNKLDEKIFTTQQNYSPNILITKDGFGIINYNNQTETGVTITKYKVTIN